MPANYTGNPNATQAPSSPPVDGNPPIGALPVDGDPVNGASWTQPFKVALDFLAWLLAPFAKALSWGLEIFVFRTALLHRRSGTDHMGFPGGNYEVTREFWRDVGFTTKNSIANGAWFGEWFYSIAGAAAGTISSNIGTSGGAGATDGGFGMTGPGSGLTANTQHVESGVAMTIGDDYDMAMQWEATHADHNSAEFDMGFYDNGTTMLGVATNFSTLAPVGAAFVRRHADANWQAYTKPFAGSAAYADTGVAFAGSLTRFRIEIRGANESDDSAARVLFYIDGAMVANVATDLGLTPTGSLARFFRVSDTNSTSNMVINAELLVRNRFPGDIFL